MEEVVVEVVARRSGTWWAITVPSIDGVFSQAKRLEQVEANAREAVALLLDVPEDHVGVAKVTVEIGEGRPQAAAVEAVRQRGMLEALSSSTAVATRVAVDELTAAGLPQRDIADLLGVSFQRVHQIATAPVPAKVERTESSPIDELVLRR